MSEQSGLFAEEGGYHITANNIHLEGGAIASTNPNDSELTTNKLTFNDIQNTSHTHAVSAGLSGSLNLNKAMGVEAKTEAEAKQQSKIAKRNGIGQSNGIIPSLPMYRVYREEWRSIM